MKPYSGLKIKTEIIAWSVILVLLFVYHSALAGGRSDRALSPDVPSVSVNILSEKPFTIGDSIDIALAVYHERKDAVEYPKDEALFTPFEIRDVEEKTLRVKRGTFKTNIVYTLTVFQTGTVTLPSLEVSVGKQSLKTEPVSIPVLSVLPRDTDNPPLKDIVGPLRARIRPFVIIVILGAICTGLILFMVLSKYIVKRLHTKKEPPLQPRPFDPYLYSIHQLEEIKHTFHKNLTDEKNVYSRISYVLRLFFGHILAAPALEMTTGEIKRLLQGKDRYLRPARLLKILMRSDMVKFAKEKPPKKTIGSDIDSSITIIKRVHQKAVETRETSEEGSNEHGV